MFKLFVFILSIIILGAGGISVAAFNYFYNSTSTNLQGTVPVSFQDSSDLFLSSIGNTNIDIISGLQK